MKRNKALSDRSVGMAEGSFSLHQRSAQRIFNVVCSSIFGEENGASFFSDFDILWLSRYPWHDGVFLRERGDEEERKKRSYLVTGINDD